MKFLVAVLFTIISFGAAFSAPSSEMTYAATVMTDHAAPFTCPAGVTEKQYFSDYESGCQMFHVCENGVHTCYLCPSGSLFNANTLRCEAAANVECSDPDGHHGDHSHSHDDHHASSHHHHHGTRSITKRSLRQVLSIPKEPLHKAVDEFSKDFAPLVTKLMRSSLPGVFGKVMESSPELRSLWTRFGPKMLPWFGRRARNIRMIYTKLFSEFPSLKIHSTDTHYNVQVSDGLIDVYRFAKDLLITLYFGEELNKIE